MKFKTDVINKTETHTERPVSVGDRKSYYEGFDNIGKTKDISKTRDVKPNKSDDIYGLLHHRERTANPHLKRPTNDHNGGVVSVTIPCNDQLEKDLGNSPAKGPSNANKHESKSCEDNLDVDMVISDQGYQEHQVLQSLGESISEKLGGVVKKSWQYKPEQFSVIKSLNENFFNTLKL